MNRSDFLTACLLKLPLIVLDPTSSFTTHFTFTGFVLKLAARRRRSRCRVRFETEPPAVGGDIARAPRSLRKNQLRGCNHVLGAVFATAFCCQPVTFIALVIDLDHWDGLTVTEMAPVRPSTPPALSWWNSTKVRKAANTSPAIISTSRSDKHPEMIKGYLLISTPPARDTGTITPPARPGVDDPGGLSICPHEDHHIHNASSATELILSDWAFIPFRNLTWNSIKSSKDVLGQWDVHKKLQKQSNLILLSLIFFLPRWPKFRKVNIKNRALLSFLVSYGRPALQAFYLNLQT